jgi:voltage-gated potassium channel
MDWTKKSLELSRGLWVEAVMAILAVVAIWLALQPDSDFVHEASLAIWAAFLAEYGWRLYRAPKRWQFVRTHLVDFAAILPWDFLRGLRLLRLVRVLRLFRGFEVLWRVSGTVSAILRTNGLGYALTGTTILILVSGMFMARIEPSITNVADGVWWSLVTATTVGYGDIAPRTHEGRLIAAFLMFAGIGTIGMLTGSIATHFIGSRGSANPHIQHLQRQLDDWDRMSRQERREVVRLLTALAADVDPVTPAHDVAKAP